MNQPVAVNKRIQRWVFLAAFAILFGPSFALLCEYGFNLQASPDIGTYLNLAEWNFDDSPVRRYRIIVPALASGVNFILTPILTHIQPWNFAGPNFGMAFSFLLVNTSLMALASVYLHQFFRAFRLSALVSALGLMVVLSSKWTFYITGLPLVDSLYFLVISMFLYGIKTGDKKTFIICIFLGPWAKESFIFFLPLFLFFCPLKLPRLIFLTLISGLLVFTFRFYVNHLLGSNSLDGVSSGISHVNRLSMGIERLFSLHGIYEILSVSGLWSLGVIGLFKKSVFKRWFYNIDKVHICFIVLILVHVLLSVEIARMWFLALPVLSLWLMQIVAYSFEEKKSIPEPVKSADSNS